MNSEEIYNPTIYQILIKGDVPTENIVEEWIQFYKSDREQALINLLQVFIDVSGCKGKLSEICDDYTVAIRNLTNEFNEDTSEYPFSLAGIKWKKFKSAFCEFLINLIVTCQNSIIYDGYMMPNVTSLLAGLSDSQVRAFRHTATLAVMKIKTALVDVFVSVSSKYFVTKRQYEYEAKKSLDRKNTNRIENLFSLLNELKENIEILNELIEFQFTAVFVNRYRDIVPAIRETCIAEMGLWMRKVPDRYIDDLHLKYIGWSLSDKAGAVRLKALQVLLPLYETGKHIAKLEFFSHKFKDRILSMTQDVETSVAVEALKLIQLMLEKFQEVFTSEDINKVLKLCYSSVSDVARKTGELLCMVLESKINSSFPEQNALPPKNYNSLFIKHLMQFHIDTNLHEHCTYLVDSLIEHCGAIKDWKCMTDLLLGLNQNSDPLNPKEENLLTDIMVASGNQACQNIPPIGRQVKKTQTPKMLKQAKDDSQKLTMHFITVLPNLLDKFRADPDILSLLLEIPMNFDLTILAFYPAFIENLELLLRKLPNFIEIYHDSNILEKCCKVLEILSNNNYRIAMKTETSKNMVIDDIVKKFKSLCNEPRQFSGELDDEFKYALSDTLLKISVFYSVFDLHKWDLWDDLFNFLNEVIQGIPEDCAKNCIVSCYFNLLWDLNNHEEQKTVSGIESEFRSRFLPFIDLLKRFIAQSESKVCSRESFIIFCDLIIFIKNCFQTLGLSSLPIGHSQKILQTFVEKQVFVQNEFDEFEASIEKLYNERVVLSSYCKLFMNGILPVYFISHLLKHYVTSFCNFGDILKSTLIRCKNIDRVDSARAVINALIMTFEENQSQITLEKDVYVMSILPDIKELARQLTQILTTNDSKDAIASYTLHSNGIAFALKNTTVTRDGKLLTSHHILFFEILIEFCHKLSPGNKVKILNFLNHKVPSEINIKSSHHQPLLQYKNCLMANNKHGQ